MPQCLASVVHRARGEVSDSHLVRTYAEFRDPEAFAELARRYGPMVVGICRKVTRHAHDAEDAAQAAFLVLARRAGSIDPDGLASWLFGVAVNTAREARRRTGRRRETLSATVPEAGRFDPEPDFDTRAAIAEELAKLPDRYRELVVRCDLEGESQAAVARRVGLPVGTVYSRLSTARTMLAGRLTRRGIAAGVAVLAVPRAAAAFVVSDCPSCRVTELTEAVMRTGIAGRWKWAAVAVLTAGVAFGAGKEHPVAPMPRPKDESRLAVSFAGHVRFYSPDGKELGRVSGNDAKRAGADIPTRTFALGLSNKTGLTADLSESFAPHGRIAPDGRLPLATRQGLYLLTPGGKAEPAMAANSQPFFIGVEVLPVVAWSPDGTKAVVQGTDGGGYFNRRAYGQAVLDLVAGTRTPLDLPKDHRVIDWSPDGSWFLTIREDQKWSLTDGWQTKAYVLCKVAADGKRVAELTGPPDNSMIVSAAISPCGRTVAYQDYRWVPITPDEPDAHPTGFAGLELIAVDVASGAKTTLASEAGGKRADGKVCHCVPGGVRWSPDGSRVAFCYDYAEVKGKKPVSEWRLRTVSADGRDPATVQAIDRAPDGERWLRYSLVDWR